MIRTLTALCVFLAPASVLAGSAKATVELQKEKADGDSWDALGGDPDIAICVVTSKGKKCYPTTDQKPSMALEPKCRDSFSCTFSDLYVEGDKVDVKVVDVDMASNDQVGEAECKVGESCVVGLSTVTISASK